MRVIQLFRNNTLKAELPYTAECLKEIDFSKYTHWKVVWLSEAKEISVEMLSSQMGGYYGQRR